MFYIFPVSLINNILAVLFKTRTLIMRSVSLFNSVLLIRLAVVIVDNRQNLLLLLPAVPFGKIKSDYVEGGVLRNVKFLLLLEAAD